jgi:hypothetical protein
MRRGMSDLEQDFELEFGDISAADRLGESGDTDEEFEASDDQTGDEEREAGDGEFEGVDEELEGIEESEAGSEYVERFLELSSRTYESETEIDESVNRVLGEMEREYFWGKLKSLARKGLRTGVGRLVNAAKKVATNHPLFKSLQGLTSLHRKGLRGLLGQLATAAASATPYGGAITGALKALDFQPGAAPAEQREAWENFVGVAREAYEDLAESMNETPPTIEAAQKQATRSLNNAIRSHQSSGGRKRGRRRVIRLRPGQRVTLICE